MKLTHISAPEFDLEKTLDSGQVFHWEQIGNGFVGAIGDLAVYIAQYGNTLRACSAKLDGLKPSSLSRIISNYFSLDHPLEDICLSFPRDSVMDLSRNFSRGLRIIRQPEWECLATFICSSMKQVGHIRQISLALRKRFGEARKLELHRAFNDADAGWAAPRAMLLKSAPPTFVEIEVRAGPASCTARSANSLTVHAFPSVQRIAASSEKELRECGLGYRAKNLLGTARLIANGQVDLERFATLPDIDLQAALCALPGVGAKVANCVMLFAYERLRAFPIDVWIERVLRKNYFPRARKLNAARLRAFTEKYFGEHGGYAQQYLFHYARKNRKKWGGGALSRPELFGRHGGRPSMTKRRK